MTAKSRRLIVSPPPVILADMKERVYYKDIKIIKFCKFSGCGVSFRPTRGSIIGSIGLCHKHRPQFYKDRYKNWFVPWWKKQTPEFQRKYRDMKYGLWKKWVVKNIVLRSKQAVESYHRRKHLHKGRRHRATKKTNP